MAIENLIFDLGGVWLPIDERKTLAAFAALAGYCGTPTAQAQDAATLVTDTAAATDSTAVHALATRLQPDVLAYEVGAIDDAALLTRLRDVLAPHEPLLSDEVLVAAWNAMLLPFPEIHLPLLDRFGRTYRMFLLSNTNTLHIHCVERDFHSRYPDRKPFLQHFEKAYLSHELHLRKPQPEIYAHVLQDAGLDAAETLFIDDRAENIAAAAALGIRTHLHAANTPLTGLNL